MWNPGTDVSTDNSNAALGDYIKIMDKLYRLTGQSFPLQILPQKNNQIFLPEGKAVFLEKTKFIG